MLQEDVVEEELQDPGLEEPEDGVAEAEGQGDREALPGAAGVGAEAPQHPPPLGPLSPPPQTALPHRREPAGGEGRAGSAERLFHQESPFTRSMMESARSVQRWDRRASRAAVLPRAFRRASSAASARMAWARASGSPGSTKSPVSPGRTSSVSC